MANTVPDGKNDRGYSVRGRFYSYTLNGKTVVCGWPPKRPKPPSPAQAQARDLFKQAAEASKRMDAKIQNKAREDAVGTPMLPRDPLYAMLFGRGPVILTTNGQRYVPMPSAVDISEMLDNLGWHKGTMLWRGNTRWEGLAPGLQGQIMMMSNPASGPIWQDLPEVQNPLSIALQLTTEHAALDGATLQLPWDGVAWDDIGLWTPEHPTRIYMPANKSRMRFTMSVGLSIAGGGEPTYDWSQQFTNVPPTATTVAPGANIRYCIAPSLMAGTGDAIRIQWTAGATGLTKSSASCQWRPDGTLGIIPDGPMMPVTFNGGEPGFTIGPNQIITSDPVALPVIPGRALVVADYTAQGVTSGLSTKRTGFVGDRQRWWGPTGPVDQTLISSPTGYSTSSTNRFEAICGVAFGVQTGGGDTAPEEPDVYDLGLALEDSAVVAPMLARARWLTRENDVESMWFSMEGGWRPIPDAEYLTAVLMSEHQRWNKPLPGSVLTLEFK